MPRKTAKKTGNNAGCLIWLIVMLIILVMFIANWNKIQETMRNTGFDTIVNLPVTSPQEKPGSGHAAQGTGTAPADASHNTQEPANGIENESSTNESQNPLPSEPSTTISKGTAPGNNSPANTESSNETKPGSTVPTGPVEQLKKTRVVSLYFIKVEEDGTIVRREVKRTIEVSDSPLTDALNALLRGPGPDELANNLISLIPPGTKLLSVQVRGSTAIINVSEEFMYNRYGVEGYAGQLKQIVYTATSFSTVKDVQILIEGQRYEYLGGEGVYIGKPISRSSL